MKILVIDGQGGKIGALLIEQLKKQLSDTHTLIAVGTNSAATVAMLRAGATIGATGENPVVVNCRDADLIIGTIGIVIADSLFGEITPAMALAVGQSRATRILIPMIRCHTLIAGMQDMNIADCVQNAVQKALAFLVSP